MSEAIHDPHAYTRLTDHVVQRILESSDPLLAEVSVVGCVYCCDHCVQAREILRKIECRELYKCVGQTAPPSGVYFRKVLSTHPQLAPHCIYNARLSLELCAPLIVSPWGP